MELLKNAKAVRFRSHLGKYLVADEDEETVRQSRNGSSQRARWGVETITTGKSEVIRLKSCDGRYLTASEESFLLGMTGKKVVLEYLINPICGGSSSSRVEWEPLKESGSNNLVKLRTKASGKFLRANGGTPPWRNSVTHDVPDRTATQDWVLWNVEVLDIIILSNTSESINNGPPPIGFGSINNSSIITISSSSSLKNDNEFAAAAASPTRLRSRLMSSSKEEMSSASSSRINSLQVQKKKKKKQQQENEMQENEMMMMMMSGMKLFERAKSVRLQSKQQGGGKYLVADEDEESVRQSRDGSSPRARWTIEYVVVDQKQKIRFKSIFGKYLTASDEPSFVFGKNYYKVLQGNKRIHSSTEWQPIKELISGGAAAAVKLMTNQGKFLRANNNGPPPWRNSVVTHEEDVTDSVLWGVDVIDILIIASESHQQQQHPKPPPPPLPPLLLSDSSAIPSNKITQLSSSKQQQQRTTIHGGMEFFLKAKSVRLRSHHDKFLLADDDKVTVCQDRHGTCKAAKWIVELVDGCDTVIRLKSCYGRYLTAADDQFLLGVTGRKVLQTLPSRLDSKVEWEPTRDGFQVRLKTRYGNYLRANGGLPPWRNSITHDIPHRHTGWILWQVDIVEVRPQSPAPPKQQRPPPPPAAAVAAPLPAAKNDDDDDDDGSDSSAVFRLRSDSLAANAESSVGKSGRGGGGGGGGGRMIYYYVANEDGDIDERLEESSFELKGHSLEQLTQELEKETGVEDVIVCSRNQSNGNIYPLRLALPPNNATMHIIVVPATSRVARDFLLPDASSSS